MRKGTNEKQAGKLKTGLSICKAFSPSLFGISYKIHLPPGKKEIRRQIQEHIQKRRPKKQQQQQQQHNFKKWKTLKARPGHNLRLISLGKKQGTLAKETKLTGGLQSGDALKLSGLDRR
jgi:hypothetical protein